MRTSSKDRVEPRSGRAFRTASAGALAAALISVPAAAAVAAPAAAGPDGWGHAQRVAGMAQIGSVSCPSRGNCSAVGVSSPSQGSQAMAVSEVHGTWRKAIVIPGTAALNGGEGAQVNSVSCASAGNCSAGGFYADATTAAQPFVASQINGTWHKAVAFPGIVALNSGFIAAITSVSCASAGNCSAGGYYTDNLSSTHLFVVSEVRGAWRKPIAVPGITVHGAGVSAGLTSVSCGSVGDCVAGGWFTDHEGNRQAFVVSQVNGTWRKAFEVPGTGTLNSSGLAETSSVSCRSAGNCTVGGFYEVAVDGGAHGPFEVFVASQVKGVWHNAIELPGTAALNRGDADFGSVSCASPGNCAAGGDYIDNSHPGKQQPFVASQVKGTWRKAIEAPGIGAVNFGSFAAVISVSCASAGNCSGGGFYTGRHNHRQAFVIAEVNGTWHKAIEVPGTAALNVGGLASVNSLSCATATSCSAVGSYAGAHGGQQAFVVNRI